MTKLPTNPGSVVRFLVPQEDGEPEMWYVASLIPGHIDDDGVAHDMVWAASTVNDPEDAGNVFSEEFILRVRAEVVTETVPAAGHPAQVKMVEDAGFASIGLVLRVWDEQDDIWQTYTYAPGFAAFSGELEDCMFTNSYGGYISAADIESGKYEYLYIPTKLV